jgi:hypothetical protein
MLPGAPDLSVLGNIHLDCYPPTRVFAVVSWGAAATSWLARTLNSHPDIFCVHAANHAWHKLGNAPLLDGLNYLRLIGSQGAAYVAAGDVHGVSRGTVAQLKEAFGENFRSVVLIRDPIPRLRSAFAHFKRYSYHRAYDLAYLDPLIDRLNLDLDKNDYERMLYVHGANLLNSIIEEVDVGPVFKTELVTTDPDALAGLARAVAGNDLEVEDEWALRAIASLPHNGHRERSPDVLTEPWVREMLEQVVSPRSWELYEHYGYEIPTFAARCSSPPLADTIKDLPLLSSGV